jgi:hypothetical protein
VLSGDAGRKAAGYQQSQAKSKPIVHRDHKEHIEVIKAYLYGFEDLSTISCWLLPKDHYLASGYSCD